MKFQKLDVLESKDTFNMYLGTINNNYAILKDSKDIQDEHFISVDSLIKSGTTYTMINNPTFLLKYPVSQDYVETIKEKTKIVTESYIDYKNKIEPYIDSILESNTKWINNILNNNSENERVLFKNDKFVILKNLSWDNDNDFYLLIIPYEKIKNIRHINNSHLALLVDMQNESINIAINNNIDKNELYFFFHYHPSCYHLHLHCCLINHKTLKPRFYRHVMLDYVIDNIDSIEKKDIKFEISISNPIFKLLTN